MKDWQRVEAVLFGSGRYLTEDQIVSLSGVSKKNLKKVLGELKKHYEQIESSLDVFNENDSWKLNVKEEYSSIVKNVISEAEMSKPIMETLALIAYKSPVFQSEIIDMRGAGAYEYITLLEEKGFITKEKSGRTFKLKITPKFYDYFDISGDSKLRQMFKGVKKPEALGTLEVYTNDKKDEVQKQDEEFTEKILERMKKVEFNPEDHEEKKKFLDEFDNKFTKAKTDIDETDKEMNEFRRVVPLQTAAEQSGQNEQNEEKPVIKKSNDPDRNNPDEDDASAAAEKDVPEAEEANDSDENYPEQILKKFEAALDELKSPADEKAEEDEAEEENEEEPVKKESEEEAEIENEEQEEAPAPKPAKKNILQKKETEKEEKKTKTEAKELNETKPAPKDAKKDKTPLKTDSKMSVKTGDKKTDIKSDKSPTKSSEKSLGKSSDKTSDKNSSKSKLISKLSHDVKKSKPKKK